MIIIILAYVAMFVYLKIQIFQNLNSITDVFLVLQAFLKSYLLVWSLGASWGLLKIAAWLLLRVVENADLVCWADSASHDFEYDKII